MLQFPQFSQSWLLRLATFRRGGLCVGIQWWRCATNKAIPRAVRNRNKQSRNWSRSLIDWPLGTSKVLLSMDLESSSSGIPTAHIWEYPLEPAFWRGATDGTDCG